MDHDSVGPYPWRLAPPSVPSGFLRRARLDDRLSTGARGAITVVTGGVGTGKTLTLASWVRSQRTHGCVAWLTLDQSANATQAFWSDVLRAFVACTAVPPDSRLRQIVPARGFGLREELLVRSAVAALPRPVVLVLDEFQRVTDPTVLRSVDRLLADRPPTLRIILASRADPTLRLHRLRVNGDVTDIRSVDLAFTAAEAAQLFAINGITLTRTQLERMLSLTQGWAAGLRLALMCLDRSDVEGSLAHFSGNERLVAEYLIEEVTDRLPTADRELLLSTSVVERVSGQLADELTGRNDGQLTLERLTAQNALVVGLGGCTDWFAVHPMLRHLLLHRLSAERPKAVAELHMKASGWFEARGEAIAAIDQAVKAQQWDDVGRLLAEWAAPEILTPQSPALVTALSPAAERATLHPTAATLLAAAILHFHRHDDGSMLRDVEDAEEMLDEMREADRPAATALMMLLRVSHARVFEPARLLSLSTSLLTDLDLTSRRHLRAREHYRVIATNNQGVAQIWAGNFADARATLTGVESRCGELGIGLTALSAQGHLAIIDAIEGRYDAAQRQATAARDMAQRSGWTREPQALALYVALALTALERGRLEDAHAAVTEGSRMVGAGSDAACRLLLGIVDVAIAAARHAPHAALEASAKLVIARSSIGEVPLLLSRWYAVAQAEAALTIGDASAAIAAIGEMSSGGFAQVLERVALAKARLLLHQPEMALELVESIEPSIHAWPSQAVEAKILEALAADRLHRETAALQAITDAVAIAQNQELSRPFLAAGPRITAILRRHQHVVAEHRQFTERFCAVGRDEPAPVSPRICAEHLTERELTVLRYLPTMYKAAEIATDLFVTVNTVKSHTQSIYRKLDVRTRRDAVDRARELDLI